MKKLLIAILLAICLIAPSFTVQAITTYNCNGLTGGTQRDLDYLSVADLSNGDRATVSTGTIFYLFKYDSTATNAENTSIHPFKVRPDDYATAGVWIEQELATGAVDAAIIASSAVDSDELATSAVIPSKVNIPGFVIRPKFSYDDADEIYIEPFTYDHQGSTAQLVYCVLQLNYTFTNLAATDWSYLYLDDSAIVTAGTNLIAVGQLIDSTTEPTYSVAKNGWYNGLDRCIFAVYTDGTPDILEFFHDGNFVLFADEISDLAATQTSDTWTDVTHTIPKFTTLAETAISGVHGDTINVDITWRTNGQAGTTGHVVRRINAGDTIYKWDYVPVITDGDQKIEIRYHAAAGTNAIAVRTHGWYFPIGL